MSIPNEETTVAGTSLLRAEPLPATTSSNITANPHIPSVSASAVLGESATMPAGTPTIKGYDFNNGVDLDKMIDSYLTTGFQATNLGRAIEEIKKMRKWRLSDVPIDPTLNTDDELKDPKIRSNIRTKIFFGYTSNQISCGQREVIKYLVQHKMVDVLVTTAGGIEEDLIKCFHPTYMGDFALKGKDLRLKGINRIGNLLLPNKNYCAFEDWFTPLLNKMHDEQNEAWENHKEGDGDRFTWSPSKMIERMGHEINNEDSVLYWAAKHQIPVFCPALTDGSVGDMMYFHSYKRSGFILDIGQDIRKINDEAIQSHSTGMIIIGGGVVKHHISNANLMRNGADFSVFINTAHDFDGSDAGAKPDEAVSWGKIRITANPVKVYAEATLVFPLIVSQTFAKDVDEWKDSVKDAKCW